MIKLETLKKLSIGLETSAVTIAITGLVYRATLYGRLPPEAGEPFGTGDIIDFAFALVLFLVCSLCTTSGVMISLLGDASDKGQAYRAVLVGVLSFIGYEYFHDQLPQLL